MREKAPIFYMSMVLFGTLLPGAFRTFDTIVKLKPSPAVVRSASVFGGRIVPVRDASLPPFRSVTGKQRLRQ